MAELKPLPPMEPEITRRGGIRPKSGNPRPAPRLKQLLPAKSERMLITGTTGCGKSTLAEHLLDASSFKSILIIDPKCEFGGREGRKGYTLIRRVRDLKRLRERDTHIQFRPDARHNDVAAFDELYWWAYERENIMVYTDELFATMRRTYATDGQRACLVQGRSKNVGMIMASQRPKGVDLRVLSEAQVFAMFSLQERDDRKRMVGYMGEEVMTPLPKFHFWFWRAGMANAIPATLKLGG